MLETIERQLENLGIKIYGSLNLEIDTNNRNVVKVYDMNISTFQKKHVATYYKKINSTFSVF